MERIETQYPRQNLGDVLPLEAPFIVYLDPCGACNFQCVFCPCNTSDERKAERHTIMQWELFERIVNDLEKFNGEIKVIYLFCLGEPLLNPRFSDMVSIIKQKQLCREVRIVTNGSLLTLEMSRKLIAAGVDLVRVSVEALDDAGYQSICKAPVRFQTIWENIATFYRLSRGTTSKIAAKIVNVTIKNEKDVTRFYQLFEDITDFHYIENVEPRWPEFDMPDVSSNSVSAIQSCYQLGESRRICTIPFTEMAIQANGNVCWCSLDWKEETKFGNAAHDSIYDLWHSETLRKIQLKHLDRSAYRDTICRFCQMKCIDDIDEDISRIRQRLEYI